MADDGVRADLQASPLFRDLAPDLVDRLADTARRVEIAAGTHVFREGQPADRCWLIHAGRVALEIHTPAGGAIMIATLGAGQVLGWSWLHPPYRWHFDARTVDGVTAFEWDAAVLREQGEADPRFGYELMRRFAGVAIERLQATRLQLLDLYGPAAPSDHGVGAGQGVDDAAR